MFVCLSFDLDLVNIRSWGPVVYLKCLGMGCMYVIVMTSGGQMTTLASNDFFLSGFELVCDELDLFFQLSAALYWKRGVQISASLQLLMFLIVPVCVVTSYHFLWE